MKAYENNISLRKSKRLICIVLELLLIFLLIKVLVIDKMYVSVRWWSINIALFVIIILLEINVRLEQKKRIIYFSVNSTYLEIANKKYYTDDIEEIDIYANLDDVIPIIKRKRVNFDALLKIPPIIGLVGDVRIKTKDTEKTFFNVNGVMEIYTELCKFTRRADAYYVLNGKKHKYKFNFSDKYSEEEMFAFPIFSNVNISNKNKKLNYKNVAELEKKWYKSEGYREALDGEAATFSLIICEDEDSDWITIFDNSTEFLIAEGTRRQAELFRKTYPNNPIIVFSCCVEGSLAMAYVDEDGAKLFINNNTEESMQYLKYSAESLSEDFDSLEAHNTSQKSIKEIFKDSRLTPKKMLKKLAIAFNMNDYLIRIGYRGICELNKEQQQLLFNGCKIKTLRFRRDERSVAGNYEIIKQGLPAIQFVEGKEIECNISEEIVATFHNIGGKDDDGFSIYICSDEIHRQMLNDLRDVKQSIEICEARLFILKAEEKSKQKVEIKEDSYISCPLDFRMELVFGQYLFVCNCYDFVLPNGLIINQQNIKTEEDRERVLSEIAKRSLILSFKIKSKVKLTQNIEIIIAPEFNFQQGLSMITCKIK